jgi:hypothetical protein
LSTSCRSTLLTMSNEGAEAMKDAPVVRLV